MSHQFRIPLVVLLSLVAAALGILFCLPLVIQETPYTFVIFMFLSQPLLAISFVLFTWKVFRDLKSKQLL